MAKKKSTKKKAPNAHIVAKLRPFALPVSLLNLDPENARKHDSLNIKAIKAALALKPDGTGGQNQLLIAQKHSKRLGLDNVVRVGNGRLQAARDLAWPTVAVLVLDIDDDAAVKLAIEDNRTGELGQWEESQLTQLLQQVHDGDAEGAQLFAADMSWDLAEIGVITTALQEGAAAGLPTDVPGADGLADSDKGQIAPRRTPEDATNTFETNQIRQIVLHYHYEQHASIVTKLAQVREAMGLESNSEIVEALLDAYLEGQENPKA